MDALNVGNNRKKGIETWNNNHNWSIPERRGRIAIEDVSRCLLRRWQCGE